MQSSSKRLRSSTLDRSLSKPKVDVNYFNIYFKIKSLRSIYFILLKINLNTFALLFSEMVQYSQNRVDNIHDLQNK
jgi:hypothetical protein